MVLTIIIGAGGDQSRWDGKISKHLVDICGEPLLVRTLRQIRGHKVFVLSTNPDIVTYWPSAFMPVKGKYVIESYLSTRKMWGKQTVLMHGDVLFGNETMQKILNYRGPARFFGTDQEMMALSFNDSDRVAFAIKKALAWVVKNKGMGKIWEIYRAYNNLPLDKHDLGAQANHDKVTDYSTDFDTTERYHQFMRHINCRKLRV